MTLIIKRAVALVVAVRNDGQLTYGYRLQIRPPIQRQTH